MHIGNITLTSQMYPNLSDLSVLTKLTHLHLDIANECSQHIHIFGQGETFDTVISKIKTVILTDTV